jgi:hypothetical protein
MAAARAIPATSRRRLRRFLASGSGSASGSALVPVRVAVFPEIAPGFHGARVRVDERSLPLGAPAAGSPLPAARLPLPGPRPPPPADWSPMPDPRPPLSDPRPPLSDPRPPPLPAAGSPPLVAGSPAPVVPGPVVVSRPPVVAGRDVVSLLPGPGAAPGPLAETAPAGGPVVGSSAGSGSPRSRSGCWSRDMSLTGPVKHAGQCPAGHESRRTRARRPPSCAALPHAEPHPARRVSCAQASRTPAPRCAPRAPGRAPRAPGRAPRAPGRAPRAPGRAPWPFAVRSRPGTPLGLVWSLSSFLFIRVVRQPGSRGVGRRVSRRRCR